MVLATGVSRFVALLEQLRRDLSKFQCLLIVASCTFIYELIISLVGFSRQRNVRRGLSNGTLLTRPVKPAQVWYLRSQQVSYMRKYRPG